MARVATHNLLLPALPYGTPLTGSGANQWAAAVLQAIHAPTSKANISSLVGWFAREGGGGENNPLNTTLPTSNSVGSFGVGVQDYNSPGAGVMATAETLLGGYPSIVQAFQSGGGIAGSSWTPDIGHELLTWSGNGYSTITPRTTSGKFTGYSTYTLTRPGGPDNSNQPDPSSILTSYDQSFSQTNTESGTTEFTGFSLGDIFPGYGTIAGAVNSVDDFFKLLSWLVNPRTWLRMAEVVIGLGTMLTGVYLLAKSTVPNPQQTSGIGGAVNAGKKLIKDTAR